MNERSHKTVSAVLSISFVVIVQLFAPSQLRSLALALGLYLCAFGIYNLLYLSSVKKFNIWLWLRPLLFMIGWIGLLFVIPSFFWRSAFLLSGVPLIYFFEALLGNTGEQLLLNQVLIAAFSLFLSITAFSHYYLLPGMVYLALLFIISLLLIRSSFETVPVSLRMRWSSSVGLSLFVVELFWALQFTPLHYSAVGLLVFNGFYLCWVLYYYNLYHHLTTKKIQFHIVLAIIFTAVILIATPLSIVTQ